MDEKTFLVLLLLALVALAFFFFLKPTQNIEETPQQMFPSTSATPTASPELPPITPTPVQKGIIQGREETIASTEGTREPYGVTIDEALAIDPPTGEENNEG